MAESDWCPNCQAGEEQYCMESPERDGVTCFHHYGTDDPENH